MISNFNLTHKLFPELPEDFFAPLERVTAEFVLRQCPKECAESRTLFLAVVLAVRAAQDAHSCVDLELFADQELLPASSASSASSAESGKAILPTLRLDSWKEFQRVLSLPCLAKLQLVSPGGVEATCRMGNERSLLVFDAPHRLYLGRFYHAERAIAQALLQRSDSVMNVPPLPPNRLRELSDFFRARMQNPHPDYQMLSLLSALHNRFTVLSGGPGTGKTTIVAALAGLLLEQEPLHRIVFCAPTGKAQAQLQNSLREGAEQLHVSESIREKLLCLPCATIHTLLKINPDSGRSVFHAGRQLPIQTIVVDECSMVPLELMQQLLDALPEDCRILFLGDRYQLSSVEAGALMADLCESGRANHFSPAIAEEFARQTPWQLKDFPSVDREHPLDGHIAQLLENHRFSATASHLGACADAIRALNQLPQALEHAQALELAHQIAGYREADFFCQTQATAEQLPEFLEEQISQVLWEGYCYRDLPKLAQQGSTEAREIAYQLLRRFQVLCAMRNGNFGVRHCNELMKKLLNLRSETSLGTPVMVTVNDPIQKLFNGDIGIIAKEEEHPGELRVFFPHLAHRSWKLSSLSGWEPAFAMTIHKSQGSGFDRVVTILGTADTTGNNRLEYENTLLSREMLYTAITRAKKTLALFATPQMIELALSHPTRRFSGLRARLSEVGTP